MKTWMITLTHLDIALLGASLERVYETKTAPNVEHILLDHHWPIDYWKHRHAVLDLAEGLGCKVMSPYENLGGHGGLNWTLRNIPFADDDLLLGVDGDAYPATPGWDQALIDSMLGDAELGALSLFLPWAGTKEWRELQSPAPHKIVTPASNGIEMINITCWRGHFLRKIGLFKAHYEYYGQVEIPMMQALRARGMQHGYLRDFVEDPRPFEPDARYVKWKHRHARVDSEGTYLGNFNQYLEELGEQEKEKTT